MRGERLKRKRASGARAIAAAAAAVIAAGALFGTAQAQAKAAAPPPKDSMASADTSKPKARDSLTAALPADTTAADSLKAAQAAGSPAADTSAADTSNTAPPPDSSSNEQEAANAADTAGAAQTADTSLSSDNVAAPQVPPGDTALHTAADDKPAAPIDDQPVPKEKEKRPLINKDGKLYGWVAANIFYIIFFGISAAIVAATIFYFLTRKDPRRFLTTTRLSVLDKMVQKACRHIEANYANHDLTVSSVCRELVTGEAYLDTLFVKEIGIDVRDFIAQVRVDRIRKILVENPDADIEAAYKQCGYNDKAAADRDFAKLCGGVGMEVYAKSLISAGKTPEA